MTFHTQAGGVIKKAAFLGQPPERSEVEQLLREMADEKSETPAAERVLAFLTSLQVMQDAASKNGHATREDCKRYLTNCERDEEQGMNFMKTVWPSP